jgi:hypothetical protein
MLIKCHKCGVQYARSFARCISCGAEPQPTKEETQEALIEDVLHEMLDGHQRKAILEALIANGSDSFDAERTYDQALALYREKMRRRGTQMASTGCGLLAMAFVLFVIPIIGRHWLWMGGIMGFALFVTGSLMACTGRNLAGRSWD